MSACTRCGTSLCYAGRPCPVCISPVVFALIGGKAVAEDILPRPMAVRLPNFALPDHLRGKKIRAPLRKRAVRGLAIAGRWTWNSLAIALLLHAILFSIAFLFRHDLAQNIERIQNVEFELLDTSPLAAADPTPLEVPEIPKPGEDLEIPEVPVERLVDAGEPEFVSPEPEPPVPLPEIAPPRPGPEMPESRLAPEAAEGLSGGQPQPSSNESVSGAGLLRNRKGETREAAIRLYGGDEATEAAVNLGLEYLARKQWHDGSWDPGEGFESAPSWAQRGGTYHGSLTALCTLPFLAAGNSPRQGKFALNVKRAVNWLIKQQTSDGCVSSYNHVQMYMHTVATLALCEAYGLGGEEYVRMAAERAVRYLERTQSLRGGWDYRAGPVSASEWQPQRNDLSITGWAVLALKSARAVGIKVNENTWNGMADLYDRHSQQNGETHYADMYHGIIPPTRAGIGMVGVGLLSRTILDADRFATRNAAAERLLLQNPPDYERFFDRSNSPVDPNFNTFYGWYCCTLGMFLKNEGRGPAWKQWNDALKAELLPRQVKFGARRGSWRNDDSWMGPLLGDLYSTACVVLCLEVYYRYNPMHRPESGIPVPAAGSVLRPHTEDSQAAQAAEIDGETLDLDKPAHRSRFLRLLAKEKGLDAARALIDHLADPSPTVRATALYEIGRLKAKDAVEPVCKMLTRSENRDLIGTICDTLGKLGDTSAAQALVRLLRDEDNATVSAARSALVRLADGKDLGTNRHAWADYFGVNP